MSTTSDGLSTTLLTTDTSNPSTENPPTLTDVSSTATDPVPPTTTAVPDSSSIEMSTSILTNSSSDLPTTAGPSSSSSIPTTSESTPSSSTIGDSSSSPSSSPSSSSSSAPTSEAPTQSSVSSSSTTTTTSESSSTTTSSSSSTSPSSSSTIEETTTVPQSDPLESTVTSDRQSLAESVTATITPVTTFQSTVFVTTTDGQGQITTSAPSQITSFVTSTGTDGAVVTITEVGVNPNATLSPDDSSGNSFFSNTGAVVGTFVLVGLAAASIVLFIFFFFRRRRRARKIEHETTLAAAGFNRTPLDDDDVPVPSGSIPTSPTNLEMNQRTTPLGSIASAGRLSGYSNADEHGAGGGYNPYAGYAFPPGYLPARTSSPPPNAFRNGRDSGGEQMISHSASHSAGSYEPLLASFHRTNDSTASAPPSGTFPPSPPPPPPRNPRRVSDLAHQTVPEPVQVAAPGSRPRSSSSSICSSENTGDDRLDPGLRQRQKDDDQNGDLRDNEDYSRPVLGVRNLPDGASLASKEST